jgi:site-specific DNA recombinase
LIINELYVLIHQLTVKVITMKTFKAILYIRVATTDDCNESKAIKSQETMLQYYCAVHNIQVIGFYTDIASGTNFERPAFNRLLHFLEQNKELANLILVTTWDRFTRNWGIGQDMIEHLFDQGIEVMAINQTSDFIYSYPQLNEIFLN